jgi:8-oxo-dGTP pyrophosphatase MutT (NUDIX family)
MLEVPSLRARLAARPRQRVELPGFRESAVLVPIVTAEGAADRLVFTVRRADLPTHAGQISFPGGKRDPGDADAAACAVREAEEELGVPRAAVEVIGMLDDVPTPTGFVITPVVARIAGPIEFRPSEHEVAAVFACDLDELAAPHRYSHDGTRTFLGVTYTMHQYQWEQHRIWGATARIVHELLALVGKKKSPDAEAPGDL